jgi:hypothetical protein
MIGQFEKTQWLIVICLHNKNEVTLHTLPMPLLYSMAVYGW